jgi:hypothetical protein
MKRTISSSDKNIFPPMTQWVKMNWWKRSGKSR